MSDIVERLNLRDDSCSYVHNIYRDAADEILRLRAEIEKLRAALKAVCQGVIKENEGLDWAVIDREALRAAAAAYRETEE